MLPPRFPLEFLVPRSRVTMSQIRACAACALLAVAIAPTTVFAVDAESASARRSLDETPRMHGSDPSDSSDDVGWNAHFFSSIPGDAGRIVTAPARWSASEWGEAAAVAGVGIALYAEDERIQGWMQRRRSQTTNRVAKLVKPFGREYVAIGLVGFAIASPFVDDERVKRTALLGGESMIFAGLGYEGLQLLTSRPRPDTGAGRDAWGGPKGHGNHSFPSGHTTAAFAFATIVADEWKAVPGIPLLAYTLATGVGLSRMNDDAHWASDAFTGAVLGYFSATAVEYLHRSKHDLTISPVFGPDEKSIAVTWNF